MFSSLLPCVSNIIRGLLTLANAQFQTPLNKNSRAINPTASLLAQNLYLPAANKGLNLK
jgi:hypothetical protein